MHLCEMTLLRTALLITGLVVFIACGKPQTTRARITERKHLPGNRLQIKYVFEQDGKQLLDSLITENKVLEGDSITVKRIPENPERSKIEFDK